MKYTLFEISWEVCNKIGGIHTVIATKAKTLVERLGDDYVCIGPWVMGESTEKHLFDAEAGFEDFEESCRAKGVAAKVGRWRIPGRPRTVLVGFSELIARKNDILAWLWERYRVDSLYGNWDYVEPALFGYAAGIVIERWWQEYVTPARGRAVAQMHEWLTGTAELYLKAHAPPVGTVFLTHATILGRSLAARGVLPKEGLDGRTPEAVAGELGVRAKHSLEGVAAREADVFATVSAITAEEAELLHLRRATPLLPNGVDLDVIDALAGGAGRDEVRRALVRLATSFLGEDASLATLVAVSGRYEVHNKGIDVLLAALGLVAAKPGLPIVLFVLVPAASAGVRKEVIERYRDGAGAGLAPLGLSTHSLFDSVNDPVHKICGERGLANAPGSRVKVIQIPVYLNGQDGILNFPYEAVLRAMDLSCFPSFYEPWGYTPAESLVLGVPTVTTDCAGFGNWAREAGLGREDGVTVLERRQKSDDETARELCDVIERFLETTHEHARIAEVCRRSARHLAWSDLIAHYERAFADALGAARWRPGGEIAQPAAPKVRMPVRAASERRPHLVRFDVAATLPETLKDLERVAHNYWWCSDPEAPALFEELSPRMWELSGHNPAAFLQRARARDLEAKARDADYMRRLRRVVERFDAYMRSGGEAISLGNGSELSRKKPIAYFCLEFGIHESLSIYGGGLGVLAGDHLKAASDLALPLVAVGLFYRKGYLQQRMSADGEQHAMDAAYDPRALPLDLARDEQGNPIEIVLQTPTSDVTLQAWVAHVGRVPLYLLDTDLAANRPEDRGIAHQLYASNQETRLRQEIVLGKGGIRLLARLGLTPSVLHLNEGHAAFAALERVGQLVHGERMTFDEARELVRASTVFTTHTPVPAGHDVFGEDLMRRYFADVPAWLGLPWERFLELGAAEGEANGHFNMTYLAMSLASFANAVSQRHGEVS
ncbi:MAG: alpha-glucan family phosphorylase, partial [Planctomycetes bacterium]|nr:alpha-glucan family phosphorylase [Planctomycetota bacterium]